MRLIHGLFLLFIVVPLVEIYVLIEVGGWIGALPTVFLVVFTAVLGSLLLRYQGFSTWARVHHTLARGELPAVEMLEGVVLLVGGALLLTPGFVTDAFGFLCLVPPLRRWAIRAFLERSQVIVGTGRGPGPGTGQSRPEEGRSRSRGRIIEGDYHRDDERR